MSSFMIIALLAVVIIGFVISTYNKMIKMRNHADEAWSDIDVQLKRRYNLIPNLVETVKGYATHEENVFVKVTEARNMAINAGSMKEQAQAENMLSGALKSLFAVSENYPQLKANENFMQLQNELVDTEDKIQAARRFYNSMVRDFNTKLQQFPNSMITKMFKFEDKEFFEVEDEEQKKNVEVSFSKDDKSEAVDSRIESENDNGTKDEKKVEAAPVEVATPAAAVVEQPNPANEAKVEVPAKPAVPAKCEKCGGEMTEGHTCPMPVVEEKAEEKVAETEAPAEAVTLDEVVIKEEEAPAEPETPAPVEPEVVAEATEVPAAKEEDKTAEAPKKEEETPAPTEESKDAA